MPAEPLSTCWQGNSVKTAVAIPLYDNPATILAVAAACRRHVEDVLVIDDGSTRLPPDFEDALDRQGIDLLRRHSNGGQGAAILNGAERLAAKGLDYVITVDADGQHLADDLPAFLTLLDAEGAEKDLIIVGVRDFQDSNAPRSSVFGRNFSNFWVKLETGVSCADTQSGFRAYPIKALLRSGCRCRRYTFIVESLVRLLWGGLRLQELPIRTIYQPPGQYVSHFRPFLDNLRFSLLHTWLVCRRLLPWPHRRLVPRKPSSFLALLRSPRAFLGQLLRENASPEMLGVSAGVGTFLAVLPLISCHTIAILYTCVRLKLNKVMALAIQNLYMPPLAPFLCIELGHFLLRGHILREASMQTIVREAHLRLLDWLAGSLVLGPLFAILAGLATYFVARGIQHRNA